MSPIRRGRRRGTRLRRRRATPDRRRGATDHRSVPWCTRADAPASAAGHQGSRPWRAAWRGPAATATPRGTARCRARADAAASHRLRCHRLLVRVIAGPYQRTRLDMGEAQLAPVLLQLGEFIGMPVADERMVFERGAQVLADGDDLDVVLAHVAQQLLDLVHVLA